MAQHLTEFVVDEQYENRKGVFTVMEIDGDTMSILWETGEQVETTISMQSRIIEQMRLESARLAKG